MEANFGCVMWTRSKSRLQNAINKITPGKINSNANKILQDLQIQPVDSILTQAAAISRSQEDLASFYDKSLCEYFDQSELNQTIELLPTDSIYDKSTSDLTSCESDEPDSLQSLHTASSDKIDQSQGDTRANVVVNNLKKLI